MNEVSPKFNKEVSPWHIERSIEPVEAEYTSYPRQTQSINLLNYWNVVIKRRRLVAILFLVVFSATAYVNFSATPLYTASAMLQIEPQNPAVTGLAEILSSKSEGSVQY